MLKKILVVTTLLFSASALAQNVQYVGPITPNHLGGWVKAGIMGDGGTSADSPITSIGATGPICSNSGRKTSPGWNSICIQGNLNAPAVISVQNYGTATAQGINFNLNGILTTLPTGGSNFITGAGTFVSGDVPTFSGTGGLVIDSGVAMSNGIVGVGAWQGTPVAVLYGGSGAATASGARINFGLGTIATQNANAVAITGGAITGMPTPLNATDVAIKSYVDATSSGLNILASSTLATAAVLPNTPTYANGSSGVGATLTAGSNTTLTVDGSVATLGTVVLVKNQASAFQNGIYTVTTAGSGSAAWVLTRATYFNIAAQMRAGSYTFVTTGSVNLNTAWTLQSAVVTVGTDALNFVQFSAASTGTITSAAIVAGLGVSISGTCNSTTVLNCTVSNTGVISVGITPGTGISVSGSPVTTTGNITVSNGGVLTIAGNVGAFTLGGLLTNAVNVLEVNAAAKADQQAATSSTLAVTPSQQQSHPSAAKAWANFNGALVNGAVAVNESYNVSGVTRTSAGLYTVSFSPTPFLDSNYVCSITAYVTSTAVWGEFASSNNTAQANAIFLTVTGGAVAAADPPKGSVVCFGNQ